MAAKTDYKPIRNEVRGNFERIRTLAGEGNQDAVTELVTETDELIAQLPARERTKLRNELREAAEPPAAEVAEVDQADYTIYEGVSQLVDEGTERVLEGVRAHIKTADLAKSVARILLDMRVRIPNRYSIPDFHGDSQAAKGAAHEMYTRVGQQLREDGVDDFDVEEAVGKLGRAVRRQMSDLIVQYIRELDDKPEEFRALFGSVADAHPELSPSEAVWAYYEDIGRALPRVGAIEKARLRAQALREIATAKERGEEPPAELLATVEVPVSERIVSATHRLVTTARHVSEEDIANLDDEMKEKIRPELEDTLTHVKGMIRAAL